MSELKSLLQLLWLALQDASVLNSTDLHRDMSYVRGRVEDEGISFLTITLPAFAKDLEQALEHGGCSPTLFRGFRRRGAVPAFLSGFTRRIFNTDGTLLPCVDVHSVDMVRQVCYLFKSIQLECSERRVRRAFQQYKEVDEGLSLDPPEDSLSQDFETICEIALDQLRSVEDKLMCYGLTPKHGPGAVANPSKQNAKWNWRSWPERLQTYFPFDLYADVSLENLQHRIGQVEFPTPEHETPVRVIHVPKTLKTPRIIAIEPTAMQYCQQALMREFYESVGVEGILANVRFRDQTVNGRIAKSSSADGRQATLDLSEASDRVTVSLVKQVFKSRPHLLEAMLSCRSTRANIPTDDGVETIELRKFASMGSGLCFPVEAITFFVICLFAVHKSRKVPPTRSSIRKIAESIHVYGDDIIVPAPEVQTVIECLTAFGLKVNLTKTFVGGKFRESCGVDAFNGVVITPVKLRHLAPTSRADRTEIVSWNATANLFYKKGMWRCCQFLREQVAAIVGPLPYGTEDIAGLKHISYLYQRSELVFRNRFQRFESQTLCIKPQKRDDPISGYAALRSCLIKPVLPDSSLSYLDGVVEQDLNRSANRGVFFLERRWV